MNDGASSLTPSDCGVLGSALVRSCRLIPNISEEHASTIFKVRPENSGSTTQKTTIWTLTVDSEILKLYALNACFGGEQTCTKQIYPAGGGGIRLVICSRTSSYHFNQKRSGLDMNSSIHTVKRTWSHTKNPMVTRTRCRLGLWESKEPALTSTINV
jgi:hypothetical protein